MWQNFMIKSLWVGGFIALLWVCAGCQSEHAALSETASPTVTPQLAFETASPSPGIATSHSTAVVPQPSPTLSPSRSTIEPGIPTVVAQLYFGVPAGNGYQPRRVAVDSQRRRVYTLNSGLRGEGNTISVLDAETGEITALLKLNNKVSSDPPYTRDLQVDPYRPRLYALWSNTSNRAGHNLTIIDTETLTVTETISNVAAIALGRDRLYLANDTRLWIADANSLTRLVERSLEPCEGYGPLLLNPQANRLYLGRYKPALIEVFAADSLAPVDNFAVSGELKGMIVDADNERLLVIEGDRKQTVLRALSVDGRPLDTPPSFVLTHEFYAPLQTAFDGQNLYVATGNRVSYQLHRFSLPNLALLKSMPLFRAPNDMAVDSVTGHLYAPYSGSTYEDCYILDINPITGDTKLIYTYLSVIDALADPTTDRLYTINEQGMLRVLRLTDGNEIARLETGFQALNGYYVGAGKLSLDPSRHRLYIDGTPLSNYSSTSVGYNQVRVVDTALLTVTARLNLPGQVTPDPTSDRLYVTGRDCGTQIINAETWKEMGILFPYGAEEPPPPMGPCISSTSLDVEHQILYASGGICAGGSTCGSSIISIFDVSDSPHYISNISGHTVAFDPARNRVFVSDSNGYGDRYINCFEVQGQTISQTASLYGAGGWWAMFYDPTYDRLYGEDGVFDGDLALLANTDLPGSLLTFDPKGQHLYSRDDEGNLFIIATGGGQLQPPPPVESEIERAQTQSLIFTSDGTRFRLYDWRLYRSDDNGQTWQLLGYGLPDRPLSVAVSPNYEQDRMLLAGTPCGRYCGSGGLYRSTDGGNTWLPSTRGLTSFQIVEIVFSPTFSRDQTIFLTTLTGRYSEPGLFRSTDSGETWEYLGSDLIPDTPYPDIGRPILSPTFADDSLVLITFKDKLLRSTDGGNTWVDTGMPGGLVAFSPNFRHDNLVISGHRWRSTDGGQTWQPPAAAFEPSNALAHSFFFSPDFAHDETIYMLLKHKYSDKFDLQRSTDAGRTWQSLVSEIPVDFEYAVAIFLPSGELYLTDDGQELTFDLESLTWSGTAEPTQPPPGTVTPETIIAPQPTITPTTRAILDPTACPTPPDDFAGLWAERFSQLGCPVGLYRTLMVEQTFEGGSMFWRTDTRTIYVLPAMQPYGRFEDTWDDSQPAYACSDLFPSQTPPTPRRGFGKVWCQEPLVREHLGNATDSERLFEVAIQEFETGLIFETDRWELYILESQSNDWEQLR